MPVGMAHTGEPESRRRDRALQLAGNRLIVGAQEIDHVQQVVQQGTVIHGRQADITTILAQQLDAVAFHQCHAPCTPRTGGCIVQAVAGKEQGFTVIE